MNKNEIIDFNLNGLKIIEFNDERIINNIQKFKLRYNLNRIFSYKAWCKLIIITPEDFNNIYNLNEEEQINLMNKLNKFENDDNKYKILYLNFKNHSPYQQNFLYFCEKYLNSNKNINNIIIDNIGEINKEYTYLKKCNNFSKIKLPFLESIIFEKEIISEKKDEVINEEDNNARNLELIYFGYTSWSQNCLGINNNIDINFDPIGIKNFIYDFFDYSGNFYIYEGFDRNNNLIYYNITHKIENDELYRIFFIDNKIITLKFIREKIEIKYDKENNQLIIIKKNKEGKDQLKVYKIKSINKFFNKIRKNI